MRWSSSDSMALMFELSDDCIKLSDNKLNMLYKHFVNRYDDYAIQQDNGSYRRSDRPLDTYTLLQHLSGEITIGSYQISLDGKVKWICLDIDHHNDEQNETDVELDTLTIITKLEALGIDYICESSGSSVSKHIWIFMDNVNVSDAYSFGREIIGDTECEVYPKQKKLSDVKPYGNLVKLPFGKNKKNDNWSHIVTSSGDCIHKLKLDRYIPSVYKRKCKSVTKHSSNCLNIGCSNGVLPLTMRPCLKKV